MKSKQRRALTNQLEKFSGDYMRATTPEAREITDEYCKTILQGIVTGKEYETFWRYYEKAKGEK